MSDHVRKLMTASSRRWDYVSVDTGCPAHGEFIELPSGLWGWNPVVSNLDKKLRAPPGNTTSEQIHNVSLCQIQ